MTFFCSKFTKNTLIFAIFFLLFAITITKSEYTWNGKEWVWSADKPSGQNNNNNNNKQKNDNNYENYSESEGSGGGYSDYDDDENSYEGSANNNNYEDVVSIENERDRATNPSENQNHFGNSYEQEPKNDEGQDIYVVDQTTPKVNYNENAPGVRHGDTINQNLGSATSFFAQPGTLLAVVGGAVVGLLCAILCVMFVVYRMRKKDEGSYALEEPKRSPTVNSYSKPLNREFYA